MVTTEPFNRPRHRRYGIQHSQRKQPRMHISPWRARKHTAAYLRCKQNDLAEESRRLEERRKFGVVRRVCDSGKMRPVCFRTFWRDCHGCS